MIPLFYFIGKIMSPREIKQPQLTSCNWLGEDRDMGLVGLEDAQCKEASFYFYPPKIRLGWA